MPVSTHNGLFRTLQNKSVNSSWVSHFEGLTGCSRLSSLIPRSRPSSRWAETFLIFVEAAKREARRRLNKDPADQRSKQCLSKHPLAFNIKAKHRTRSWLEGYWVLWGTRRRCNGKWLVKRSVDLMYCLEISLIKG